MKYDQEHEQITIYEDDEIVFYDLKGEGITIKNLRDTLCHSFVFCELVIGKIPIIMFDDRAILPRNKHDELAYTEKRFGMCCSEIGRCVDIPETFF